MKRHFLTLTRTTLTLVVTALVGAFIAITASAQNTVPTAPADRPGPGTDRGNRGDRGDRGNRGDQTDRGNLQGGRAGFGGRGGFGGLGLDEKQMDLYREASEQNRDALTKLDEKLRAAQKELLQAVIAEKYDDATVTTKAEVVAKIQTEMTVLRAKALSTVAPTLKPEQRETLENSRVGAAMLTGGGMGGFGGGPGGGGTGGGFGGPGGPGGADGTAGGPGGRGGFRGRDGQGGQGGQGGQAGTENTGDRGGGGRRGRPPGQ